VSFDGAGVIQQRDPVPYYFQLSTYIAARVKSGDWRPGQFLPSEQEMCGTLGISRTVVRQALVDLERKGLVVKQNGKRTKVASPKYEGGLMQNLQGFQQDVAAHGRKTSTKVLNFEVVPADVEVAEALKIAPGAPVLMLNRLRFLDGEPQALVVSYLPERLCASLSREDLASRSLHEILALNYGLRIARGFRTIEAIGLDRADARLLRFKTGGPALLLKSIGLLADGTPLEYFVAKHRGDHTKFYAQLVQAE
jgi:GntR family transcriptional regulator